MFFCVMPAGALDELDRTDAPRQERAVAEYLAGVEAEAQVYEDGDKSQDERKRVEMRFAHLKSHHGFERMRLRGLSGARDEFHPAATCKIKTMALRYSARQQVRCTRRLRKWYRNSGEGVKPRVRERKTVPQVFGDLSAAGELADLDQADPTSCGAVKRPTNERRVVSNAMSCRRICDGWRISERALPLAGREPASAMCRFAGL
jgi:hypothetical protein